MRIKSLSLVNFRNFKEFNLNNLSEFINIVSAPNASGKSNLLESIYMLSLGTSPRTRTSAEVIRSGEKFARVYSKIEDDDIALMIKKNDRTLLVNNKTAGIKELREKVSIVYFHPPDLRLFSGSPINRRRFLDRLIAQLDLSYIYTISSYSKLLSKRNAMLKEDSINEIVLHSIEEEMAKFASILILTRAVAIDIINSHLTEHSMYMRYKQSPQSLREIIREFLQEKDAGNKDILTITTDNEFGKYAEIVREKILQSYNKLRGKEQALGFSLFGPQRDDFVFYLKDGLYPDGMRDIASFGSRGEQRMSVIRLKLVESKLLRQYSGLSPILLLDDIFSELDEQNRDLIHKIMRNQQTFITTADALDRLDFSLKDANVISLK